MITSGGAGPRGSGWIRGTLGMLDQDETDTGRGSWGRERELDEEPTLLQDSEPEEEAAHGVIVQFPRYFPVEALKRRSMKIRRPCLSFVMQRPR